VIVLSEEWVAGFDGILTVGAVPQVAQKQFAQVRELVLQFFGLTKEILGPNPCFVIIAVNALKNVFEGLGCHGPGPADITTTRWYIQFNGGDSSTVLPAVMLFLHKEIQFF